MANKAKVIIHVYEGIVTGVYSNDPGIKVIMVDQDNIDAGDESPVPEGEMRILRREKKGRINGEHFTAIY